MKTFDLEELRKSPCPNLMNDLLTAGKFVRGRIEVPDEAAERILAGCPGIRGFGDVVAIVAQPVARLVDAVVGTKLAECGGCKARREALNNQFPFPGKGD